MYFDLPSLFFIEYYKIKLKAVSLFDKGEIVTTFKIDDSFDVYLTSLFSYFLRFISFLILVPIAGGLSSVITKFMISFLMSFFVVFGCGITIEDQNFFYEILIGFLFSVQDHNTYFLFLPSSHSFNTPCRMQVHRHCHRNNQ